MGGGFLLQRLDDTTFWFFWWYYGGLFLIPALISVVVMFVYSVPMWSTTFELKKAMRDGEITASGSKYSFSNPLTYVIRKKVPGPAS